MQSDDCSSNIHDMCSGGCDCECHGLTLDNEDLKVLYNFISNQYISYENLDLINLIKRISDFVEKN